MPVGIVYAIWAGLGTVATVAVGVILWREATDIWRILGVVLIIAGVVVLNFVSNAHAT